MNIIQFTKESKKFMEGTSTRKFWLGYPRAFIIFYSLTFKDWLRKKRYEKYE